MYKQQNNNNKKPTNLLQSAVHVADTAHVLEANEARLALVLDDLVGLLPKRRRPRSNISRPFIPILSCRLRRHWPGDAPRPSKPDTKLAHGHARHNSSSSGTASV